MRDVMVEQVIDPSELADLRGGARHLLARRSPPEHVAVLADRAEWDRSLYAEIAALGWLGPEVRSQHLGVLAEELGYVLAPVPWLGAALAAVVVPADDSLHEEVEAGRAVVSFACAAGEHLQASVDPGAGSSGMVLTGHAPRSVDAGASSHVVVLEAAGEVAWVVELEHADVVPEHGIDPLRGTADIRFDRTPARRIGAVAGSEALELRLAVLLTAEHLGLMRALLDLGVQHASTRVQFGRPIGSYEGVSHRLAAIYVDVEEARSLSERLTVVADAGRHTEQDLALARLAVTYTQEAAVRAAEGVLQVHGGMGMTWDHPLHRWYRRAIANERLILSRRRASESAAHVLLDSAAAEHRL